MLDIDNDDDDDDVVNVSVLTQVTGKPNKPQVLLSQDWSGSIILISHSQMAQCASV